MSEYTEGTWESSAQSKLGDIIKRATASASLFDLVDKIGVKGQFWDFCSDTSRGKGIIADLRRLVDDPYAADTAEFEAQWRLMGSYGLLRWLSIIEAGEATVLVDTIVPFLADKQANYGTDNITEFGHHGIIVRVHDKIARALNLEQNSRSADELVEPYIDCFRDLLGYSIVALMLLDETFYLPLERDLSVAAAPDPVAEYITDYVEAAAEKAYDDAWDDYIHDCFGDADNPKEFVGLSAILGPPFGVGDTVRNVRKSSRKGRKSGRSQGSGHLEVTAMPTTDDCKWFTAEGSDCRPVLCKIANYVKVEDEPEPIFTDAMLDNVKTTGAGTWDSMWETSFKNYAKGWADQWGGIPIIRHNSVPDGKMFVLNTDNFVWEHPQKVQASLADNAAPLFDWKSLYRAPEPPGDYIETAGAMLVDEVNEYLTKLASGDPDDVADVIDLLAYKRSKAMRQHPSGGAA